MDDKNSIYTRLKELQILVKKDASLKELCKLIIINEIII